MNELEVKENVTLRLTKVLWCELLDVSADYCDQEIPCFTQRLKELGVDGFGPLVTKSWGMYFGENGIRGNHELIVQAHNYESYKDQYFVKDDYIVEGCLYLRYEGSAENIQYAHHKISLYLYEHNLENSGITYSIFVEKTQDYVIFDLFRPLILDDTI